MPKTHRGEHGGNPIRGINLSNNPMQYQYDKMHEHRSQYLQKNKYTTKTTRGVKTPFCAR